MNFDPIGKYINIINQLNVRNSGTYNPSLHKETKDTVCFSENPEKNSVYNELIKEGIQPEEAEVIAASPDKYLKLKGTGLDVKLICTYMNLLSSEKQIETLKKLTDSGMSGKYAIKICVGDDYENPEVLYDDKTIENITVLKRAGAADIFAESGGSEFTDEQISRFCRYINGGLSQNLIYKISSFEDETYSKFTNIVSAGLDEETAAEVAQIPDELLGRYEEIKKKGIPAKDACALTKFDDTEKACSLYKKGINTVLIGCLFKISPEQYERFEELCKYSDDFAYCIEGAMNSQYEKIKSYLQEGIGIRNAFLLIDEERRYDAPPTSECKNLVRKGVNAITAGFIAEEPVLYDFTTDKLDKGLHPAYAEDILNLYNYIESGSFAETKKEKLSVFKSISNLKNANLKKGLFSSDEIKKLNKLYDSLGTDIKHFMTVKPVSESSRKKMIKGFFANNDKQTENVIKSADFGVFGENGIPLKYSRSEFLDDLSEIFSDNTDKKNELCEKLEITPVFSGSDLTGYNGFINLSKLNPKDKTEKAIYKIAHKFLYENKPETGNKQLDETLESLYSGLPEFIEITGKIQHPVHDLSLDAHILKVLSEAMKNPDFESLSDKEKSVLKWAIILHDIAKSEGITDKEHPHNSAQCAKDIMQRYNFSPDFKDNVYDIVDNHHMIGMYHSGKNSAEYTAAKFRRAGDFKILKIMADADLKGVSEHFYEKYISSLSDENLKKIISASDKINKYGQIIFTSKIIKPELIPEINRKDNTYKVIDFTKMKSDEDLAKFGFAPGTAKNTARLLLHMCEDVDNLETLKLLSETGEEFVISSSYVSPEHCNTYIGRKFGVSLDCNNYDIVNAYGENQLSGCEKNFEFLVNNVIPHSSNIPESRLLLSGIIKKELNLSDEEYKQIYEKISGYKYENQIKDNEEFDTGEKTITGSEIKSAIKHASDRLLKGNQNEINVYKPKISAFVAKVDSIDEIPEPYLNFAKNNNYPVFILGKE